MNPIQWKPRTTLILIWGHVVFLHLSLGSVVYAQALYCDRFDGSMTLMFWLNLRGLWWRPRSKRLRRLTLERGLNTKIESHVVKLIKIRHDFMLNFVIFFLNLKVVNDVIIIIKVLNRSILIFLAILVINPHLCHLYLFLLALTFPHVYFSHCCLHELGHFAVCTGKVLELFANVGHISKFILKHRVFFIYIRDDALTLL